MIRDGASDWANLIIIEAVETARILKNKTILGDIFG